MSAIADIAALDLVGLADAIASRRISAVETMQSLQDRIERLQPVLNCFIQVDFDAALRQAREADADLARGRRRGPLHGVPVAHKDMYYRAGRVSTCGSKIRADFRPDHTATVLERLDAAGAIEIGTLNMAEFALYPTGHNVHYGACRNPWDTNRVPGGSSSGSGAGVAARLCYGSLGSDSGGSTRIPAAFCGVSGLKPTAGRVSRYGVMPVSHSLDHVGPLAPSVRDLARILTVIAGSDPHDPVTSALPASDYEIGLERGIEGLRIGVPRNYFFDDVPDDIAAALEDGLAAMRDLGAEIVPLEFPEADLCATYAYFTLFTEWSGVHAPWLRTRPDDYGAPARNRLLRGLAIPATRYHEALTQRGPLLQRILESVFGKADLLWTPTTIVVPPTLDESDEGTSDCGPLLSRIARNTRIFNYLGLPALSIPCGFGRAGMPVGAQLIGKPFGEARLLSAGHAFQQATDWHRRRPPA
jgi:aspartyl-tRNA(Asn)/glutamyl-tRNA(Gln) amidotransferase subunit A